MITVKTAGYDPEEIKAAFFESLAKTILCGMGTYSDTMVRPSQSDPAAAAECLREYLHPCEDTEDGFAFQEDEFGFDPVDVAEIFAMKLFGRNNFDNQIGSYDKASVDECFKGLSKKYPGIEIRCCVCEGGAMEYARYLVAKNGKLHYELNKEEDA